MRPKPSKQATPLRLHAPQRAALAPKSVAKRHVEGKVDQALFDAVRAEIALKHRTITEVIEWGFREYLLAENRRKAAKLGIRPD